MFPSLETLHTMVHFSLSLEPIPANFDIGPDYLQSLMILVALVLALGFSILVLLALYLCLVISCLQPVNYPSTVWRLLVMAIAIFLAICAGLSVDGNRQFAAGLDELVSRSGQIYTLTEQVGSSHPRHPLPLGPAARFLAHPLGHLPLRAQASSTAAQFYFKAEGLAHPADAAYQACMQCVAQLPHPNASDHNSSGGGGGGGNGSGSGGNGTEPVPNGTDCTALLRAAHNAQVAAKSIFDDTNSALPQISSIVDVLSSTTGWHEWAATLPLFALTCTAVAVVAGTVGGRRNLLVLAQFFAVIVWWMMCAVVSVEFAIAVGMADACADPVGTLLRVLWNIAAGGAAGQAPAPSHLWTFNLSAHYVANCSYYDPFETPFAAVDGQLRLINATLAELSAKCPSADDPRFDALLRAGGRLGAAAPAVLAPLGGCGGNGTIGTLFDEGVAQGLCAVAANGLVAVFAWQTMAGLMLLLLTLLLPILWHSHVFPPMSLRPPRRRRQLLFNEMSERSSSPALSDADDDASASASLQPLDAAAVDAASAQHEIEHEMATQPLLSEEASSGGGGGGGGGSGGGGGGGGGEPSSSITLPLSIAAGGDDVDDDDDDPRIALQASPVGSSSGGSGATVHSPDTSPQLPRQGSASSDISSHEVL